MSAACVFVGASSGHAADIEVVGFSPNRVVMTWTVTNRGSAAVARIEFPIHRVNRADPPPKGWEIERFDQRTRGKLIFRSTAPQYDLRSGDAIEFACTMHQSGLGLREGAVTVGLRDGSSLEIAGVLLPDAESAWQVYGLPVFLAGLLAVAVLVKLRKRSRAGAGRGGELSAGPGNDVSGG
jgi:hypothetical protein